MAIPGNQSRKEKPGYGRRRGPSASFLPWILVFAGVAAATWAYFFFGRGPSEVELLRVRDCLENWKLEDAARLLGEMKKEGSSPDVEGLSRELAARRAARRAGGRRKRSTPRSGHGGGP